MKPLIKILNQLHRAMEVADAHNYTITYITPGFAHRVINPDTDSFCIQSLQDEDGVKAYIALAFIDNSKGYPRIWMYPIDSDPDKSIQFKYTEGTYTIKLKVEHQIHSFTHFCSMHNIR